MSEVSYDFSYLDARLLQPLGGIGYKGSVSGGGRLYGPMKKLTLDSLVVRQFEMLGLEYADRAVLSISE